MLTEATVRERDEFLSVVAHELKSPFTSLLDVSQLVVRQFDKEGPLAPEEVRAALQIIVARGSRLARLVNRLLTDACFTNSRLALEKERVDLSVLVERVVREMQKTATKHAIAVRMSGALEVTIDPLYIEQVVANLLDNAIRYNPNGGSIEVAVSSPSSGDIHVSVCDHGIGISPDQRTHLFDRFHRAHSESYQSGLGIGLYISRQIVELHGGTISAQFPLDGGTCFVVTLPRDRAENRP